MIRASDSINSAQSSAALAKKTGCGKADTAQGTLDSTELKEISLFRERDRKSKARH
jgi:hypothetical protein